MLSHIFSYVVRKLHATRSHSFSTCVLLTMKPFQNTFLWSLMPEETNKGPALTSSVSQVITLWLVILVLSSVIQEKLRLPHAGHSLFQSAPGDPAEPSNPSGADLGKVYLEKGKILLGREGWGEMWKKQPWRQQGPWERRERGCSRCWTTRALQLLEKTTSDADFSPEAHESPQRTSYPKSKPWQTPCRSKCLHTWRKLQPVETHHRIRLLVGTGAVGRSPLREKFSGKSSEPVRVPHLSKGKVCGARSSREELLWTDNKSYSPTLCTAEGGETIGIRNGEWTWAWEKEKKTVTKQTKPQNSPKLFRYYPSDTI